LDTPDSTRFARVETWIAAHVLRYVAARHVARWIVRRGVAVRRLEWLLALELDAARARTLEAARRP
jgi:hypothetical protein